MSKHVYVLFSTDRGSGYFIILMVNLLRVKKAKVVRKSPSALGYNHSHFTREETEAQNGRSLCLGTVGSSRTGLACFCHRNVFI